MKYAVHLYPTVRVKVTGIEAENPIQAFEAAQLRTDLHAALDNEKPQGQGVEGVFWDEGENNYVLIDTLDAKGDFIEGKSVWLDGDGRPMVDGKTLVERRAAAADDASLFMQELLVSVETLSGIVDTHGLPTLVDLMYLQAAILSGGSLEINYPESAALEMASSLPSGARWASFFNQPQHVAVESQR